MPARVIFSDGSKAMAHNNEDLFDRWLIRKSAELEQRPIPVAVADVQPEFVPDLPELTDLDQVLALRLDRNGRSFILAGQRAYRKVEYASGRIKVSQYSTQMAAIKTQMARLSGQREVLAAFLRANRPDKDLKTQHDVEKEMLINELDSRCNELYQCNLTLKQQVIDLELQVARTRLSERWITAGDEVTGS